ncbi:MAG: pantetheine-phosphate adenylyltransferase [Candidatus Cloacimonetes bacterium]|nr:pantetheine-phosphate adenylyltransferase [Candidatus Cloacimonadota bacterium]
MRRAIYPGTFDPITNGHIDILLKATSLFDEVILAVAEVTGKDTLFSTIERENLCRKATEHIKKVKVERYDGLSVNFARKHEAIAMIRGLRAVSDFEYELQIGLMNNKLEKSINTVFLIPDNEHLYLSSSIVKQIMYLGGEIENFLPKCAEIAIKEKISNRRKDEST